MSLTITAPGESFFLTSQAVGLKTFFRSQDGSLDLVEATGRSGLVVRPGSHTLYSIDVPLDLIPQLVPVPDPDRPTPAAGGSTNAMPATPGSGGRACKPPARRRAKRALDRDGDG